MAVGEVMQTWIRVVTSAEAKAGVKYFIGKHLNPGHPYHEQMLFLSRGLNRKLCWSGKPGIALVFEGGQAREEALHQSNEKFQAVLVEVPADADRRWRARAPVWK